jgi:hypothetical protein
VRAIGFARPAARPTSQPQLHERRGSISRSPQRVEGGPAGSGQSATETRASRPEWPDFFPEWQDGTSGDAHGRMLLSPEASHTGCLAPACKSRSYRRIRVLSKSDLALGGRSYYRRGRLVGFPNRHFLRSQSCSSYPVAFGCGIGRSESLPRSTGFTIVRPIIAADRVEAHVMVAPVSSRFYPGTGWCCSELDDSAIARASRGRRDKSTGQQFCAHAADPR